MRTLIENAMKKNDEPKDVVILIGNIRDPETRIRHDKILAFGIAKRNFDMGYGGQLLVKCPKRKVKQLLEVFPIVEGCRYWQTTHYWEGATI